MSNASRHTDLPWRVSWNKREVYAENPQGFTTPFVVADCSGEEMFGPLVTSHHPTESESNAAFIVRACNSHDELLAACKEAEIILSGKELIKQTLIDALIKLQQAIKNAEARNG